MKIITYLFISSFIFFYSCSADENIDPNELPQDKEVNIEKITDATLINSLEELYDIVRDAQHSITFEQDSLGYQIFETENSYLKKALNTTRAQLVGSMVKGYISLLPYPSHQNKIFYVRDFQLADKLGITANKQYYVDIYQAKNTMTLEDNYSVIMRESPQMGLVFNKNNFDFLDANKGFFLYFYPEKQSYSMTTSLVEFRPLESPSPRTWYPIKPANLEFLFYILIP